MSASSLQGKHTGEMQSDEANPDISSMALYNLSRAHSVLASLSRKPKWTNADTSSFDCMHYDGDTALDNCASQLGLQRRDQQPDQQPDWADKHILDIGSGFSATGRFLASKYKARVTGIELQRENHELAQRITSRNVDPLVVQRVRSVNADFLSLTPESLVPGNWRESSSIQFNHIVSLLCIMHIPKSARAALFRRALRFLKPGGGMYIEDFYDASCRGNSISHLTKKEIHQLQNIIACPCVPSAVRYMADVTAAGFDIIEFEDVSMKWKKVVRERSDNYGASGKPNAALEIFYDTVAEIFEGGHVGGFRMTAVKRL